jgi:uncharacterized oxidoreductase
MQLSNNKILITGGASGIGFGLTERFVKENNTVLICGRRKNALKAVTDKYPSVISRVCDLSKADERGRLYSWIKEEHPDLNVLINNAGIQQDVPLSDINFYQQAKEENDINIDAPIHLASMFVNLKSLKVIMNVTSGLAFVPIARFPVYCASKAFLHSFTQSIRHILKPKGIEVIEIIPPALSTELGGQGRHDYAPPVSEFINSVFEQLKEQKTEITFGFSEGMLKSRPEDQKKAFARMNPEN